MKHITTEFSLTQLDELQRKERLEIKVPCGVQKRLTRMLKVHKSCVSICLKGKRYSPLALKIRWLALHMGGWYN